MSTGSEFREFLVVHVKDPSEGVPERGLWVNIYTCPMTWGLTYPHGPSGMG
jgi:hypothetical protein